jgi:hypothetical protein
MKRKQCHGPVILVMSADEAEKHKVARLIFSLELAGYDVFQMHRISALLAD